MPSCWPPIPNRVPRVPAPHPPWPPLRNDYPNLQTICQIAHLLLPPNRPITRISNPDLQTLPPPSQRQTAAEVKEQPNATPTLPRNQPQKSVALTHTSEGQTMFQKPVNQNQVTRPLTPTSNIRRLNNQLSVRAIIGTTNMPCNPRKTNHRRREKKQPNSFKEIRNLSDGYFCPSRCTTTKKNIHRRPSSTSQTKRHRNTNRIRHRSKFPAAHQWKHFTWAFERWARNENAGLHSGCVRESGNCEGTREKEMGLGSAISEICNRHGDAAEWLPYSSPAPASLKSY